MSRRIFKKNRAGIKSAGETTKLPVANYLPNLPVKLKVARGKLEKYAREKFKIARGKSQKYARDQNNCPWQISKSKSFTGKKKFHGEKKNTDLLWGIVQHQKRN